MKMGLRPLSSALFTLVILHVPGMLSGEDGNMGSAVSEIFSSSPDPIWSSSPDSLLEAHQSQCKRKLKCSQCIQTPGCLWCNDKNLTQDSRCYSNELESIQCTDTANPQGGLGKDEEAAGVTNGGEHESGKIHPQVVRMRVRKGERQSVTLTYTDDRHRPLDLYIVMDLSHTMKNYTDRVATLAKTLADNLLQLTRDLRIGFGSFVDKPLAPFGFLVPPKKGMPNGEVPPYGFKNHLKLTANITQFTDEVKQAGISSNTDYPEGTLDGLLQSIVCTTQIGWRIKQGARKLVVVSTDGSFHMAGDGKLVGAVLPHDGDCYLDSTGLYTHATVFDYPSVSLVRQRIRANNMFVIFAVTEEQKDTYSVLSNQFQPFAVTQGIDNENNSITKVIEKEYKTLVNTVKFLSEHNLTEYIDIKFFARCPGQTDFHEGDVCEKVGPQDSLSFKIEVELKDCPSKRDLLESAIKIFPQSSKESGMVIKLSMLCTCDCENEQGKSSSNPLLPGGSSSDCSGHGYTQCGICVCDPGYSGPTCNCSMDESKLSKGLSLCVNPNATSTGVCSGRGRCDTCGICTCKEVIGYPNAYSGDYCECDNRACPLESDDKGFCNIDAKVSQGECHCGECVCRNGFSGPRCECPGDEICRDPHSPAEPCNGEGQCQCGKCLCDSTRSGNFCEFRHANLNDNCISSKGETEKCVRCFVAIYEAAKETDVRKACEEQCKGIEVDILQTIESLSQEEQERACKGSEADTKECRVNYVIRGYNTTTKKYHLEIESMETVIEECKPPPIFWIIIIIIGAILVIGVMLILLWKIITHIQDKKEYERFEKAIDEANWNTNENPLYKSTTSEFRNPAYMDFQGTDL